MSTSFWRAVCAMGLIGTLAGISAIEHGASLLPTFLLSMLALAAFGLGAKLGGLMYE